MVRKRKKNLTPEEVERLRNGLVEIRRELHEIIVFLQAKLGHKPA